MARHGDAFAVFTDTGYEREANEDSYAVTPNLGCYVVTDGMGGHGGGADAARIGAAAVMTHLASMPAAASPASVMRGAIMAGHAAVVRAASLPGGHAQMGATAVAAMLSGTRVSVAHAGDSRCYHFSDSSRPKLRQVTRDHSLYEELVDQGMQVPPIELFQQRNVVTRALGYKIGDPPSFSSFEAHSGDIIMLCTDGLTGPLTDPVISAAIASGGDLKEIATRLGNAALFRGGPDNITIVLARV